MKKICFIFMLIGILHASLDAQIYKIGTNGGDFPTLREALDFINQGNLTGDVTLRIVDNTIEDSPAILYESGHDGLSSYTSVTIYPTVPNLTISGNFNGPLINLDGADNLIIDGRVNQTGAGSLSIINTNAGTSATAITFTDAAQNNTIKYCNIQGSELSSTGGIIFFGTDASSNGGNSNNTIDHNNITAYAATGRPLNVIYSSGSSSPNGNSSNTISSNNIFDFLNPGQASNGIAVLSNSSAWNITGNSFYETTTLSPSAGVTYNMILVNNPSGTGFTISGNYIGGQSPLCAGGPFTKSGSDNPFNAINITAGSGVASSIQSNTIKNFAWSNTANSSFTGINIGGGDMNVGTVTGNFIGKNDGFIIFTGGATNSNFYGINIAGSGIVDCEHNGIGFIITVNTGTNSTNTYGIKNSSTGGTTTMNINSITFLNATSTSTSTAQYVYGIYNSSPGTITISSNIINNLTNGTTNSSAVTQGLCDGIASTNGTNVISNNSIHDLSIANANSTATQTAAICGIAVTSAGSFSKTVSGNTIYTLSNSYSSFTGSIIGIYFSGSLVNNSVSGNFIYGLAATGGSVNGANIHGIKINAGTATYANNIINLGGNTPVNIYGIWETGTAGNNNNLYFNTIYISGAPSSGAFNSYALYNNAGTNTRDFRNNILYNARSNSGASGKNYAIRVASPLSSLTIDFNDYFVTGSGGVLGFLTTDKTTLALWKTATGQDVSSLNIDPTFISAGSTSATDYKIASASLPGVTGTGINVDFGLNPRGASGVTMGVWESAVLLNKWAGTTDDDWSKATNWTAGSVPPPDANIIFSDTPVNNCKLDQDRSVTDVTNNQAAHRLVINGHKLTVKGTLIFTNSAQIDATVPNSTIEFAGLAIQYIPQSGFYNDQISKVVVNNANNVIVVGTLNILNTVTSNLGRLDAVTYSPSIVYGGASAQSIDANQYLNDRINNLTIDNTTGVAVNTNFTIANALTINSEKHFIISPGNLLTVSGPISNNGGVSGFLIRSDGTGDGRLINSSSSVNATVELFMKGGYSSTGVAKFHYFTPPVGAMNFNNSTTSTVASDLGLTHFGGDLLSYSEAAAAGNRDAGWQYFDGYDYGYGPTTPFSQLLSTQGYNFYVSGDDKITFKGTLNSTDQIFSNLSFTNLGWNLVGNPFPCNYDMSGIPELTATGDGVNNTIYFNKDGGYAYWNVITGGTTGYSNIIPPLQGFFVQVTATGKSLTLPASSKTAATSSPRSKALEINPVKKIKLVLNNGTAPDETIVCLLDQATNAFDGDFDGYKLFGSNSSTAPYIYTELNTIKYAINSVADPSTGPLSIPVTVVIKNPGTYKIDITEFENLEGYNVELKHGDVLTPLSQDASYTFTLAAGTYNDFQLLFNNITTPVEKTTIESLKTWYNNNFLYINYPDNLPEAHGNLKVFDTQGKQVYNSNSIYIIPGQTNQISLPLQKGMYIINLNINNQRFNSKIVVF